MAITAAHIKVVFRYVYMGQNCANIQYYATNGAAFLTASMEGVLEALWNDVKGSLRALTPDSQSLAEWGGLAFAEYAVSGAERLGTRASGATSEWMPSFVAGGFRQTVGTRLTRPGQKRFPFVRENDVDQNNMAASYLTPLEQVAIHFTDDIVLGAPVATGVLTPVVGGTVVAGVPTVFQDIIGYVLDNHVTSQVSRKLGRGA
jgi:hypothetical protein